MEKFRSDLGVCSDMGAVYWLSRPTQMVLAAAGATSTMAHSVRLAIWLGFVDMLPAAIVDVLRLQPTVTRPTRSVGAYLFISCL